MSKVSPRTWTLRRWERENHVEIFASSGPCPEKHEYVEAVELEPILDLLEHAYEGMCERLGTGVMGLAMDRIEAFLTEHGRLRDDGETS